MAKKREVEVDPLIPIDEVAKGLGVHVRTVYSLVQSRKLKGYKIGSRSIRILQSSLSAFLANCEIICEAASEDE